jgi:hypothetical protein
MPSRIRQTGIATAALSLVLICAIHGPALAVNLGCTLANVAGFFGAYGGGTVFAGNAQGAPAGPFSGVELVQFDGHGNYFILNATLSFSGATTQNLSSSGTYTVSADCTGSITETSGVTANLIFVNNRNDIFAMDTFLGVTDNLIFKRVNPQ